MDVRLPDGTVIQNVPDGMTKAGLASKLAANGHDTSWYQTDVAPENRADYQYDPTSGMSGMDKFMAGAGKSVVDMGRGIRQIGAEAGQLVGLDTNADQYRQQQDQLSAQDAPLMRTGAGIAGNIAGNIAATYAGGSLLRGAGALAGAGRTGQALNAVGSAITSPTSVRGAATVGAAMGGIQPVGVNDSRTMNATIGGAVGGLSQMAANAIGKIGTGAGKALDPADARAVATLEKNGVQLDAAQKSGSTLLRRLKAGLSDNPMTAGAQEQVAQAQKSQFNQAVLKSIGVDAESATPETMGAARKEIGQMFNSVLDNAQITPSKGALNQLQVLAARSRRVLTGDSNPITHTVDDIIQHVADNGGKLDGRYYQQIRGDLGALTSEKGVAPIASEMLNGLDNAFQQGVGADQAGIYQQARRMWRNMKVIEGAIATDESGNISAAKLANAFGTKKNRIVGVYGKGDESIVNLAKLAKAGKQILPEKLANSGTTARIANQALLPAAGAAYGYAKEGDIGGAAKYAALGYVAPKLIQGAINSPAAANYLANGLQPGFARNALMAIQHGGGPLRLAPIAAVNALTK
jgi:hypothetical protein